jgi:hypothetical protein
MTQSQVKPNFDKYGFCKVRCKIGAQRNLLVLAQEPGMLEFSLSFLLSLFVKIRVNGSTSLTTACVAKKESKPLPF